MVRTEKHHDNASRKRKGSLIIRAYPGQDPVQTHLYHLSKHHTLAYWYCERIALFNLGAITLPKVTVIQLSVECPTLVMFCREFLKVYLNETHYFRGANREQKLGAVR
jgi:hypothetical protein